MYWSESANIWVLSRYDDISTANADWKTYSSAKGNLLDELPNRAGGTLGTTDPPRHDQMRACIQHAFSRRSIDGLVAPIAGVRECGAGRSGWQEELRLRHRSLDARHNRRVVQPAEPAP